MKVFNTLTCTAVILLAAGCAVVTPTREISNGYAIFDIQAGPDIGQARIAEAITQHAFGFRKYAHRYLGRVQYLFNRRFDLHKVLERLARAASQALPCPTSTVRAAEPSC
jgi:hypothetical protein